MSPAVPAGRGASVDQDGPVTTLSASARAVRRRRNGVAAAFALGGLNLATWGPRLPAIKADLRVGDGTLGLLVTGMTIASLLGLASSSWLLGRLGPRRGLTLTLTLMSVGVAFVGIASGVWHSPWLTEVGLVVLGYGIGTTDVMINVEGAAVEQASGKVLMPLLHACWSFGAVAGSAVGAIAAALAVPPSAQFSSRPSSPWSRRCSRCGGCRPPNRRSARRRRSPSGSARWAAGWTDLRLLLIGVVMLGVELGEGIGERLADPRGRRPGTGRDRRSERSSSPRSRSGRRPAGCSAARSSPGSAGSATVRITTAVGVVGIALFILGGPAPVVLLGTVLWAIGVSMGFPLGMSAAAEGPNAAARRGRGGVTRLRREPRGATRHRVPQPGRRAAERLLAARRVLRDRIARRRSARSAAAPSRLSAERTPRLRRVRSSRRSPVRPREGPP